MPKDYSKYFKIQVYLKKADRNGVQDQGDQDLIDYWKALQKQLGWLDGHTQLLRFVLHRDRAMSIQQNDPNWDPDKLSTDDTELVSLVQEIAQTIETMKAAGLQNFTLVAEDETKEQQQQVRLGAGLMDE